MTKQEIQKRIEELQSQINELKRAIEKAENTCFSRVNTRDRYYAIGALGGVSISIEEGDDIDDIHYAIANYCTDQDLMKKRAAEETLSRLIWREMVVANIGRKELESLLYIIRYNKRTGRIIYCSVFKNLVAPGESGFLCIDDVQACIENVVIPFVKTHPELGWELKEQEN